MFKYLKLSQSTFKLLYAYLEYSHFFSGHPNTRHLHDALGDHHEDLVEIRANGDAVLVDEEVCSLLMFPSHLDKDTLMNDDDD